VRFSLKTLGVCPCLKFQPRHILNTTCTHCHSIRLDGVIIALKLEELLDMRSRLTKWANQQNFPRSRMPQSHKALQLSISLNRRAQSVAMKTEMKRDGLISGENQIQKLESMAIRSRMWAVVNICMSIYKPASWRITN
jgi:hypothetical protein